ncbi:hypothetical protein B0H11DRAFT_2077294 [Mycena galericulata]|nr:hypothetical protein B0H11DRAFT_2077294 [Mycena galericulata]
MFGSSSLLLRINGPWTARLQQRLRMHGLSDLSLYILMPAHPALPLDDDLDRILTFCGSFGTLKASILVSKAFYRVFRSHPKSIIRAVAYNIVGPSLPQALRVVRYPYHLYDSPEGNLAAMAAECPEDQDIGTLTAEEKEKLQENSRVVEELEGIYSVRNKDRKSKTSLLAWRESWRFRRAMYRMMLFSKLFSEEDMYGGADIHNFGDGVIRKVRLQRTAVLDKYSTAELHELYSVVKFMRSIVPSSSTRPSEASVDSLLAIGPTVILRSFQLHDSLKGDPIEIFVGYFSLALGNIWTARKITPPSDNEPMSTWILDEVNGTDDTCSQCAAPGGINLYTEANWSLFPTPIPDLLQGNLRRNWAVQDRDFFTATDYFFNPGALDPLISKLFTWARGKGEFDGWTPEDSYCFDCLTYFLEENLWRWFLEQRITTGWVPPKNCKYGLYCEIQGDQRHAETRNHLCVPTKDDSDRSIPEF